MIEFWKKITVQRPWMVIGVALAAVVFMAWYGMGLFNEIKTSDQFTANNTESMAAKAAVQKAFGTTPTTDIILFERKDVRLGTADSAVYQAEVARLLAPLATKVNSIKTYATTAAPTFLSKDKTATYAAVEGKGTEAEIYAVLNDFSKTVDTTKLTVTVGGASVVSQQMNETVGHDLARAEMITFPILLVLLVLFFGSAVAALVPLLISAVTIVGAFAVARAVGHAVTIDHYAVNVITILGIGLAIDYALLSVNRFREELREHGSVDRAVRLVIDTSGRTVFFSAITVIACMLSLMVFPLDFLHSIAIGGSSAVLVAMLFTVLVLPALLKVIGKRIDAWHLPFKRRGASVSRFWKTVATTTTKHPVVAALSAVCVIGLAWLPLSQLTLSGAMDYRYIASGTTGRYVMKTLQNDFAAQSPAITAVLTMDAAMPKADQLRDVCTLADAIGKVAHVSAVTSPVFLPNGMACDTFIALQASGTLPAQLAALYGQNSSGAAYKFSISLDAANGTRQADDALMALRALQSPHGEWLVGGMEGYAYDTNATYMNGIPTALIIIAVSMMILLTLLLASVIVPLQAIIINTISLALSFAVLVLVFQLGWFNGMTGWESTGGIVMTPLILIAAIAFGLAMDYSVFLYSRMYEVYHKTGDHVKAVQQGIIKTGPIISAAAAMVFVVVVAFAASSVTFMRMIGVGLGVAVLVDAFFVRLLLVPSIMTLMGKATWYAPRWVQKFRIRHE